jgi:hypothetical protein
MAEKTETDVGLQETLSSPANDVKDLTVADEAVQLAHEVGEVKYKPFTKSMLRLYGCLAIAYLCGCLNGFDGSLMGGINAMDTYLNFFHM